MSDTSQHPVAWRRVDVPSGTGIGSLVTEPDGYRLEGAEVVVGVGPAYSCRFTVRTDLAWVTREVRVEALTDTGARAVLLAARAGRWTVDGVRAPDLDGCLDVDIASVPVTATLPIRRLGISPRQTREIAVVGIDVPGLAVYRTARRCARLPAVNGVDRYEYDDPSLGASVLRVDHDGMVIDHEGRVERMDR